MSKIHPTISPLTLASPHGSIVTTHTPHTLQYGTLQYGTLQYGLVVFIVVHWPCLAVLGEGPRDRVRRARRRQCLQLLNQRHAVFVGRRNDGYRDLALCAEGVA